MTSSGQPRIAIGIGEGEERPVASALGVGTRLPRLDRERRAVPDVAHLDAAADKLGMGGLDVGDDQSAFGRARRGRRHPRPNVIDVPEPGGVNWTIREPVHRGDVVVEPPPQALVEPLGPVDVGHGNDVHLEFHVDVPDVRVPRLRL